MTDKSTIRAAREARGMSRAQLAAALNSTVHKVWHCEMPPFDGEPELMIRIQAFLGLGGGEEGLRQASGGHPRRWRCPSCHQEEDQFGVTVYHQCIPGKGKFIRLNLVMEGVSDGS